MTDENAKRRANVAAVCVDANQFGEPSVTTSPSGRYRLTVQQYLRKPPRWCYTRGIVTRVADGATVCDLQRNLDSFQHSFVTKEGREYLIAGRSYMSQTIVDLDRGEEYEPPGDQYGGGAFCWASCLLSPDGNTLAVDGCIWAAPYEFQFYDFTDPRTGWRGLKLVGVDQITFPDDDRKSGWIDATTFDCFHMLVAEDGETETPHRTRVQRRGDQIVVLDQ